MYDTFSVGYNNDDTKLKLLKPANKLFEVPNESKIEVIITVSLAGYDPNIVFHIVQFEITIANACAIDEVTTAANVNLW